MSPPRLIAVSLDLDRLDLPTRDLLAGIQRYAAERPDWRLVLDPFPTEAPAASYDGIIGWFRGRLAPRAHRSPVPLVSLSHAFLHKSIIRVVPNRQRAGRIAARHLLARGFTRFAYFGWSKDPNSRLQLRGYRAVLRAHPCSALFVPMSYRHTAGRWRQFTDFLARSLDALPPPAAVLAANDTLARHLADACIAKGLRIPDDIGVLGVGNDPSLCEALSPALSSVDLACGEVGYRAAQLLDRLIAGGHAPAKAVLINPAGIVVRQSTDIPVTRARTTRGHYVPLRGDDSLVTQALRHIAEHVEGRLRVGDVARACGVPLRTLQRRFAERHSRPIADEIAAARLARAQRLLRGTDLSIADIARAVGFPSRSNFARHFKRLVGLPPARWRREHRPRDAPAPAH